MVFELVQFSVHSSCDSKKGDVYEDRTHALLIQILCPNICQRLFSCQHATDIFVFVYVYNKNCPFFWNMFWFDDFIHIFRCPFAENWTDVLSVIGALNKYLCIKVNKNLCKESIVRWVSDLDSGFELLVFSKHIDEIEYWQN